MTKLKVNSVVKLYTLCLLKNGPKHGYELIKDLETSMDRSISASHVYPFLKDLEDNKVIRCKAVEQREKKQYSLTKEGEHFIELVFDKLDGIVDSVIERRLSTCEHCSSKVLGGYSELIEQKQMTFCCKHCANAYKQVIIR